MPSNFLICFSATSLDVFYDRFHHCDDALHPHCSLTELIIFLAWCEQPHLYPGRCMSICPYAAGSTASCHWPKRFLKCHVLQVRMYDPHFTIIIFQCLSRWRSNDAQRLMRRLPHRTNITDGLRSFPSPSGLSPAFSVSRQPLSRTWLNTVGSSRRAEPVSLLEDMSWTGLHLVSDTHLLRVTGRFKHARRPLHIFHQMYLFHSSLSLALFLFPPISGGFTFRLFDCCCSRRTHPRVHQRTALTSLMTRRRHGCVV